MKNFIPDSVSKFDNVYDVLKERGFIESYWAKKRSNSISVLTRLQTVCISDTLCRLSF